MSKSGSPVYNTQNEKVCGPWSWIIGTVFCFPCIKFCPVDEPLGPEEEYYCGTKSWFVGCCLLPCICWCPMDKRHRATAAAAPAVKS